MDLQAQAQQLRAEGKLYREIAKEFGVSESTANRWCDPEVRERHRVRSAARNRKRRNRCDRCERPCYGLMCRECRNEDARFKAMVFHRLWNAGLQLPEIAKRMGWTQGTAGSHLTKYRSMGLGLPYRMSK